MAKQVRGSINHIVAVRLRLNGTGNLKLFLRSNDDVFSQTLVPIVMETLTDRMPNQLANFKSQFIQIEFGTTEINEVFTLGDIIAFIKPVSTGYPQ